MNARKAVVSALTLLVLAVAFATLAEQSLNAQSTGTLGTSTAPVTIVSPSPVIGVAAPQSATSNVGISAPNDRDLLLRDRLALDSAFQGPTTPYCGGVCFNSGICGGASVGQPCTTSGHAGTCQYTSLTKCICGCM